MQSNPLISIVIPCYNSEKYLAETIESVFRQSFKNYEVILVDDGSTDATQDIINLFRDRVRSEVIHHGGVSIARNRGTQISTGRFIQYLDSDDLLRPDALEKKVNALLSNDADVAYSDWQKLERKNNGIFYQGAVMARRIEEVSLDPEIACFTDFWAPPGALLYSRRIVDTIGGWNQSLPIIEDARFLFDAALNGAKFIYVPGVGMDYRITGSGSLSTKSPTLFVHRCLQNAIQVEELWINHGGISEQRMNALLRVYGMVARASYGNDKPTFETAFSALERLCPGYIPREPKNLRALSKLVGYRRAERFALWYRRAKKVMG